MYYMYMDCDLINFSNVWVIHVNGKFQTQEYLFHMIYAKEIQGKEEDQAHRLSSISD